MDIMESGISQSEKNVRGIRVYVRTKGILTGLIENTSKTRTPATLLEFLKRITQDGKIFPENFLLPIEKERLKFDSLGRLWYFLGNFILQSEMNFNKKKLMISLFLIHRILLGQILLNPTQFLSTQINEDNKK